MNEQTLRYALAKQVPDMKRGFTVATSYGGIVIPPGKLATRLKGHMQRALMRSLLELELAKADAAATVAAIGAHLEQVAWHHINVAQSAAPELEF